MTESSVKKKFSESNVIFVGNEVAEAVARTAVSSADASRRPAKADFFDLGYLSNKKINELDNYLEQNNADHIIIELGGSLKDALYDEASKLIWLLAETVLKHFSPEQILFVHLSHPNFIRIGKHLRPLAYNIFTKEYINLREAMEADFIIRTNCYATDITKYYFYCKRKGYRVSDGNYEPECYEDILRCAAGMAEGVEKVDVRPDIRLSLKRYIQYKPGLQTKPYAVFLNKEYLPDNLIVSSIGKFVDEYKEQIAELEKLDWSSPEKAVGELDTLSLSDEFRSIVKAFFYASKGEYSVPDARYDLMFRNASVPANTLEDIRTFAENKCKVMRIQVNAYNAGIYFAKMTGQDEKLFAGDEACKLPVVVDIFGSCWSRTAFNVVTNDFAVNHYWFHVPPIQKRNPKVKYDPEIFNRKLSWIDKLIKAQFEHKVDSDIEKSDAEWLMLDLYALFGPNEYLYKDCIYGDFKGDVSKKIGAEHIRIDKMMSFDDKNTDLWKALDSFFKLIKKKYGDRIILINGGRKSIWLGDNGVLYNEKRNYQSQNEYMYNLFKYDIKKLDCYSINIADGFVTDDNGIMARTPSHVGDRCYYQLHSMIRKIVDTRPAKKNYARYNGGLWIKHLMSLVKKNPPERIKAAIRLDPIDECILQMGYENIKKYWQILAKMYRFDLKDPHRTLEEFDFEGNFEVKKLLASVVDKPLTADVSGMKADYPVYERGKKS